MKPRISSLPRTEAFPEAALKAWGFGCLSKIKPAGAPFKRLISWALGLSSLWLLLGVLDHMWPGTNRSSLAASPVPAPTPAAYPGAVPDPEVRRAQPVASPAPRATLVERPAPRALPVYHIGDSFQVHLPDGRTLQATERGAVPIFSSLPSNPQIGDHYTVTEGGAAQGVSWLWYTPLGWNHPAWIDP